MRDTFVKALQSRARLNPDIFLMVGDLGFGVVDSFAEELPNQFLNAGIAEQNMVGMAAGLASRNRLPFIYSIANFPTLRCLEQIRNDVCYHNLPVTIVSIGAGMGYGTLGYSHFAIEDLAILRALPGIRVLSPADPIEVKACLDLILQDPQPTYLRLGKNGERNLHSQPLTKLNSVEQLVSGDGVLVLVTGSIADEVISAVNELEEASGVKTSVYSVPIVKPLNLKGIDFKNYKKVITVEEHTLSGGFGSAILEYINSEGIVAQVLRIGLPDEIPSTIGSHAYLRKSLQLDAKSLASKISSFLALS